MRSIIPTVLISLLAGGCVRTQTTLVNPGQPIRLLVGVTAPANATATEVSRNQWIVNDNAVTLPAGAYVIVLPASTQPANP